VSRMVDGVELVGEDGLGRSEDLCGDFLGVFVLWGSRESKKTVVSIF